jgi:hypothetical protein
MPTFREYINYSCLCNEVTFLSLNIFPSKLYRSSINENMIVSSIKHCKNTFTVKQTFRIPCKGWAKLTTLAIFAKKSNKLSHKDEDRAPLITLIFYYCCSYSNMVTKPIQKDLNTICRRQTTLLLATQGPGKMRQRLSNQGANLH